VSRDFHDAHNIVVIISGSPTKPSSIVYHITKENSNATQFVAFIKMLIINNEILVMDNAWIHTAGEAECVKFFYATPLYLDYPLHVKIVYLPARCPELNPIEFMFHLLSSRIWSFQYQIVGAIDHRVI
jgi:transposase